MNELIEKKIRFSDAARAIGLPQKTLRNWMQRNKLNLISDYSGPQWTEFVMGDIAILAIMRHLTRWGVSVQYANEIAFTELVGKGGPIFQYRNTPAAALVAQFRQWDLFLYGEDENGDPTAATIPRQDNLPSGVDVFLYVNLGGVIGQAFGQLTK